MIPKLNEMSRTPLLTVEEEFIPVAQLLKFTLGMYKQ